MGKRAKPYIIAVALILLVAGFHICEYKSKRVEQAYRRFCNRILSGEYQEAYDVFMSVKYKEERTIEQFIAGSWCASNDICHNTVLSSVTRLVYVMPDGLNPLKARTLVTGSAFLSPYCRDGYSGLVVEMVYEDGRWVMDGDASGLMQ